MNDKIKQKKDFWEKLDILSKIGSGLILALIALVLKIGTDKISASLQTGQLVQSLISDLSAPDSSKIRQEIALVALDQTLWKQNQEMVLEICERIIKNINDYDQITGALAFQILQSRDPERAAALFNEIKNYETGSVTEPTINAADKSKIVEFTAKTVIENPKLLNRVKKNRVYIHFSSERDREKIKELHKMFLQAGFDAPGIQRVEGNYDVDIRYFHNEDSILIGSTEQILKNFLNQERIRIERIPIKNFSRTKYQNIASVGLIEIWINLDKLRRNRI